MNDQDQLTFDSALLREVLNDFLDRSSKDAVVPTHVLAALKNHFETKTSISAQEVKTILTTSAEVS